MPKSDYEEYKSRSIQLISDTLADLECQPIFFVGTGISKRYINAPNWNELLSAAASYIGMSPSEFSYIRQKCKDHPISIGSALDERTFEWAWAKGKNSFPPSYFDGSAERSLFFKHVICHCIESIAVNRTDVTDSKIVAEIELMKKTNPHAVITTNYDGFLEEIFPEYEIVVGDSVIRRDMNIVGEIFKIHGTVSEPSSIVITGSDYDTYRENKKYISAKLLTYLAEHPVFIFGYSLTDPNVNGIIQDIGRIIGGIDGLISNIFYVEWRDDAETMSSPRSEYVIGSDERQYRVRAIVANDLSWIFETISQQSPLTWVDPRVLRAVAARFYKLIRSDIPRQHVEIDYDQLKSVADVDEALPKLLGIARVESPNISHPYILTDVAKILGYRRWHYARKLVEKIRDDKGVDITTTDNQYHYSVPSGRGCFRRWSKDAVELLKRVRDGQEYTISL